MTRKRAILTLAALIGFATTLAIEGCAHPRPVLDPTPRLTAPLAVVTSELHATSTEHAAARKDLADAIKAPSMPPAVVPLVRSADEHVAAAETHTQIATTQAAVVNAVAVQVGKESVQAQTDRNAWQDKYNKMYNSWPEVIWRGIKWIAIVYFSMRILSGVLVIPAAGSPLVAIIKKVIDFILSAGGTAASGLAAAGHSAYDNWHNTPGTPAK